MRIGHLVEYRDLESRALWKPLQERNEIRLRQWLYVKDDALVNRVSAKQCVESSRGGRRRRNRPRSNQGPQFCSTIFGEIGVADVSFRVQQRRLSRVHT